MSIVYDVELMCRLLICHEWQDWTPMIKASRVKWLLMAKNKRESVWWQNNRSSLCFLLGFAEKPSWVLRFETLNNQREF